MNGGLGVEMHSKITPTGGEAPEITNEILDGLNISRAEEENKKNLDNLGGVETLAKGLKVDLSKGISPEDVEHFREMFGPNVFPHKPMKSWFRLFFESFNDVTLLVLIAAAVVALAVGIYEDPGEGYIEGTAILVAVLIVAVVTATNDYTKELQFRSLEESSKNDERATVLRGGEIMDIHPNDLVVGDVAVFKSGDGIPADGILFQGEGVKSDESALTGESDHLKKEVHGRDPFLLSSSTITDIGASPDARMLVTNVGPKSQFGRIRANLVDDPANTPLQDKLDDMAKFIGYIGIGAALATFIVLMVSIWARHDGQEISFHVIEAFLISITIIVVAIPEGLPLAVTISLAYSTKRMYEDQNLIRVLAACETMGNATNICSDKTGTLTENRMTVVEGWFGNRVVNQDEMAQSSSFLSEPVKDTLIDNFCTNGNTRLKFIGEDGEPLHKPKVIGSATEGALLLLTQRDWGVDYEKRREERFDTAKDRAYPFSSAKKRSTVIVFREDGSVRLYCKGASEMVLRDCSLYMREDGTVAELRPELRTELENHVVSMADRALRTLCIAHRDFPSKHDLPTDWENTPPDHENLVCDGIVGIIDPLRSDVKEAVATAQSAGVMVRMVTGDNINTAIAIAKQCGILTEGGIALEGPNFRKMTPAELDAVLPKLQVLARSSPDDKYLLVTRLNGHGIPSNKEEWEAKNQGRDWDTEKDLLLPGYKAEWEQTRPDGGQIVGVTGDGTNDAPALKAADVGLSMGLTGTQVAKDASDIVILDDKFSSIVKAIMWGRSVYDNIRKFLQFQLTVNVVALSIVFIGACAGFDPPLNAVMMLWVNLIMDTMGALALGTELPTPKLLERRPYKRGVLLISRPMWRNIAAQSIFQLVLLMYLLFDIRSLFEDVEDGNWCKDWSVSNDGSTRVRGRVTYEINAGGDTTTTDVSCQSFEPICGVVGSLGLVENTGECFDDYFESVGDYDADCLKCEQEDYLHFSILFNAFVFCQVFNEFNARDIFDEWNVFRGIHRNPMFLFIIIATIGLQAIIIEFGGEFTRTTSITGPMWGLTMLFGLISVPLAAAVRFIPMPEDPETFAGYDAPGKGNSSGGGGGGLGSPTKEGEEGQEV